MLASDSTMRLLLGHTWRSCEFAGPRLRADWSPKHDWTDSGIIQRMSGASSSVSRAGGQVLAATFHFSRRLVDNPCRRAIYRR